MMLFLFQASRWMEKGCCNHSILIHQTCLWPPMCTHAGMSMEEGLSGAAAVDTNPQPAESVLAVCSDQNLLKDIFHRLDIRDLCSASCVCSLWNQVGCCC